jgi:transposase
MPKIGPRRDDLDALLLANEGKAARERLTLVRIFETLRGLGYDGGYDAIRRYAKTWRQERGTAVAQAFVPLSFAPGEAYQFDWSHEIVLIDGATVTVKVAHVRLCHSRMLFVRAYPRESQEMVFDAHDRAFAFFKGACTRGIYDNMKTAVETILVGTERVYNRRFLQMCGHYLVDPVACTPASGWEKGQVENQVGLVRERFFTPRLRMKSYDDLNGWLLDQCIAYAKAHRHPELRERTIWEAFEAERPNFVPYTGRFDGFHAIPASVSKTCLVRFDNNKYSVTVTAPWVINQPMNRRIFETYIETQLAPTLQPGDVVILDNLASHKSEKAKAILKERGAWFLFLPPYSPDLNPIEMAFSKLKAYLRRIKARTIDALWRAVGYICNLYSADECWNCLQCLGLVQKFRIGQYPKPRGQLIEIGSAHRLEYVTVAKDFGPFRHFSNWHVQRIADVP